MKITFALALVVAGLQSAAAFAAEPEACLESLQWNDSENDISSLIQDAAYSCQELADFDKRIDSAIVDVDTLAAFSICTGQAEATVTLAASRVVLGAGKILIRNLSCKDTPQERQEKAAEAACSIFVTRGLPCKDSSSLY